MSATPDKNMSCSTFRVSVLAWQACFLEVDFGVAERTLPIARSPLSKKKSRPRNVKITPKDVSPMPISANQLKRTSVSVVPVINQTPNAVSMPVPNFETRLGGCVDEAAAARYGNWKLTFPVVEHCGPTLGHRPGPMLCSVPHSPVDKSYS